MTINDLHMTEEQIVNEIQFMRMWDKYLQKMLGKEKHSELSLGFARMLTSAELKSFGASDEEIEKACNFADMMAIADEHKADTPQTDCKTCKYGQDKHRYAHICNECGVGINNYTPQKELTAKCLNCHNAKACKEKHWDGCIYEPQTDIVFYDYEPIADRERTDE